jgi:hypothetical protein
MHEFTPFHGCRASRSLCWPLPRAPRPCHQNVDARAPLHRPPRSCSRRARAPERRPPWPRAELAACSAVPASPSLPALNRHRHRSRHPVLYPARHFSELRRRCLQSPARPQPRASMLAWPASHGPPPAEPRPPASARGPARAPPPPPPPPTCLLRPMVTSSATSLTVIRDRDLIREFD